MAEPRTATTVSSSKQEEGFPFLFVRRQSIMMHSRFSLSGGNITILSLLICLFTVLPAATGTEGEVRSSSNNQTLQQLDESIRDFAFQKLSPLPKTGIIYDVNLPSSLKGIKAQAVRLRSGSLRRHGLTFNEFIIPVQSILTTSSKYVILVYREFKQLYPRNPPLGFTLVAPVLGINIYEGTNLSTSSSSATIQLLAPSTSAPIIVRIPFISGSPQSTPALCASFLSNNSFNLFNITSSPNVCSLQQLIDSTLAIQSLSPSPSPSPSLSPVPAPSLVSPSGAPPELGQGMRKKRKKKKKKRLSTVAAVGLGLAFGGVFLLVLLAMVTYYGLKMHKSAEIAKMQAFSDNSQSLHTSLIAGRTRAPTAAATRTKPVLETDYAP